MTIARYAKRVCQRLGVVRWAVLLTMGLAPAAYAGTPTAPPADESIRGMSHHAWSLAAGAPPNIWGIQQDELGFVWLATTGAGLVRFDGLKFEPLRPFPGESFASRDMTAFRVNSSDDIWIGTSDGVVTHVDHGHITNHVTSSSGSNAPVFAFAAGPDGAVWAAGHHQVLRFVHGRKQVVGADWGIDPAVKASWVVADQHGAIWISTSAGLLVLKNGAARFEQTGIPTDWHTVLALAPDGTLWASDASYGTRALPGLTPDHVPDMLRHPQKIPDSFVTKRFAFDRSGAMWGSLSAQAGIEGIFRIAHPASLATGRPLQWQQLTDRYSANDGLSSSAASPIMVDANDAVWIGTVAGLDRFRTNHFKSPRLPSHGSSMTWLSPGVTGNPVLLQPRCVFPATVDRIEPLHCNFPQADEWGVYRSEQGIFTLVQNGLMFSTPDGAVTTRGFPGNLTQQFPTAVNTDRTGKVWIGFSGGPYQGLFSLDGERWNHADLAGPENQESPTAIGFDEANRAWIGYGDGHVVRWDGKTMLRYGAAQGLSIGLIAAITVHDGVVFVGGDRGVARLGPNGFQSIASTRLGGPAAVTGMAKTPAGDIWLNTTHGVVRLNAREAEAAFARSDYQPSYDLYTSDDGLNGVALMKPTTATISTDEAGRLWFANNEGVSWVDPAAVQSSPHAPHAVIDTIVADGTTYLPEEVTGFPPLTSSLTFQYSAASFVSPQNVKFRYVLRGASNTWQSETTNRQATFANLGPGSYTFDVVAADSSGTWSTASSRYTFEIAPAFYQMLRFQILAGLTVLACLAIFIMHQFQRVVANVHDRLEIRHAERKRIARDMHDTLLQGVQALILTFQAVADQIPKSDPLSRSVEHALDRAEGVLVDGRNRVQDMRKREDVISNLPMALAAVGEQQMLRTSTAFELSIIGEQRTLDPGVSEESYLIAREALLNAFRHGQATRVEVQVSYTRKYFQIVVSDDGLGVDPEVMRAGGRPGHWGLSGMRERAQNIGAQLRIWSTPRAGTQVELSIPARFAFSALRSTWRGRLYRFVHRWRRRDR